MNTSSGPPTRAHDASLNWFEQADAISERSASLVESEWAQVEDAARSAYSFAGLNPPISWLRARSPVEAALFTKTAIENQLGDEKVLDVRRQVATAVWEAAAETVADERTAGLSGPPAPGMPKWSAVHERCWTAVTNSFGAELRGAAMARIVAALARATLTSEPRQSARLEWFRDVANFGARNSRWLAQVGCYSDLQVTWSTTWTSRVFVGCDRPSTIMRDSDGNLHSEEGPAVAWSDHWSLNAWHGTFVPDDFHAWDWTRVVAEPNAELRRCGIERLGWENLTAAMQCVDETDDPGNPGESLSLYRVPEELLPENRDARLLVVSNASLDKGGRRRRFGLLVPSRHRSALTAAADLFGLPASEYAAIGRAT